MPKRRSDPFWEQFELLGSPERPNPTPIATSAEISETALNKDERRVPGFSKIFFDKIYWSIERNWGKYLVASLIYGVCISAWFLLSR
jgi:hypothetical protein